jgi:hypothetical protein
MRVPTSAQPEVQQSFRELWAAIDKLQGPPNVDLSGRRMINAGNAQAPQDYVTLAQVSGLTSAGGIIAVPAAPRPVSGILVGTHADRLTTVAGGVRLGTAFFETDRAALYLAELDPDTHDQTWTIALCRPLRTADGLPDDLDAPDAGFTWFNQVGGVTMRWSGGAWNYYLGSKIDVFSARPDPDLADRGFLFIATDRGHQVWRKGASSWILLEGVGGPTRTTLGSLTGGLTADDAGYLCAVTDYDRLYRWSGSGWEDAPGQPTRGLIAYFAGTGPGPGWALCNGSGASMSTASGGTSGVTTPDLITDNRFLRAAASAGGTGGNALTHTHAVDPPSTGSGGPSATVLVTISGATPVGDGSHTHPSDIASFSSGPPSGTLGVDALPPYYDALPYMRL